MRRLIAVLAALVVAGPAGTGRLAAATEVFEEIVAKVGDDVITKTDLAEAEQEALADLYRRYSGKELDEKVASIRSQLLRRMIEQKILFHRAQRIFDLDKAGDAYLRYFKDQQKIATDADLTKMLAAEGMTIADLKKRLIESFAPQQVINTEVGDRVVVSDKEVDAYYAAHPEEFEEPAVATVREIVVLADAANREAARARAEEFRAEAAAPGADFGAVARERSDSPTKSQDGLLGSFKKGDLAATLEKAVFAQAVGEVGPVLEADYGFHIVKVDERKEARVIPLEEARAALTERLTSEKYQKLIDVFMKKAWSESTVEIAPGYKDRLALAPTGK